MLSRGEIDSMLQQIREAAATGRLDLAERLTTQLIEAAPTEAEAWSWRGLIDTAHRRFAQAEIALKRATELQPGNGHYWSYLATALREQGQAQEAEVAARRAIAIDEQHAAYWVALGATLSDQNRWIDTAAAYRQAVERNPNDAAVWQALAVAEEQLGELDAAETAFKRSLAITPGGEATIGHAHLLALRGQSQLGIQMLVEYLDRVPHAAVAAAVLFHMCLKAGNHALAEWSCRRALQINAWWFKKHPELTPPLSPLVHSSLFFMLPFFESYDRVAIDQELRRWDAQHAQRLAKNIQPHANDRSINRRLRVGYVSPNFSNHCQVFFMMPLLAAHDHSRVEVFCYSDVTNEDVFTGDLRAHADGWRDTNAMTDAQIADLIRQDQIDILVDLTMHMERNRLLVFAHKPAPVQVCWLAYPGSTGMSAIDYRLTDPHIDPPGLFDRYYCEHSVRLPDTFWCYDSLTDLEVSPLPAIEKGYLTFGNLNSIAKVNPTVLKLWARVLKAVDRSRMVLLAPPGSVRQSMLDVLTQEGIEPARITFVTFQPRPQYLREYQQIDVMLDTTPYNGHTTSLDAFWMGVPVVTLVGQTVVGRAGLSMLRNLGLPELAAETPDQFVQVAVQLAGNLNLLGQLRAILRERMQRSPLMDAPRFARGMEAAYRWMWERWCLGGS